MSDEQSKALYLSVYAAAFVLSYQTTSSTSAHAYAKYRAEIAVGLMQNDQEAQKWLPKR